MWNMKLCKFRIIRCVFVHHCAPSLRAWSHKNEINTRSFVRSVNLLCRSQQIGDIIYSQCDGNNGVFRYIYLFITLGFVMLFDASVCGATQGLCGRMLFE